MSSRTAGNLPSPEPDAPTAGAGVRTPDPGLAAAAVAQIMRPLARLMIGHGVQLSIGVELLKKALVDEAAAGYGTADKAGNDSRVAVLTGVHRKDVRRLRDAPVSAVEQAPLVSVAAAVVACWISHPAYLDASRQPRPLARTPRHAPPGEPDFAALVAEVSRDVGARAVLSELQRLGVVAIEDDVFVCLKKTAFVPEDSQRDAFHYLAGGVEDHFAAAVHNLSPALVGSSMLEQSAFSTGLTAAQAQELHDAARRLWAAALRDFLQAATQAERRSQGLPDADRRVRFGSYFFSGSAQPDTDAPAAAAAPPRRPKIPKHGP
ncbi:MAG TPA: DUF6502 family protein [Burkholderiaceae bacterium]|nr:DUF6502 family protein [Burkholderiaceae bacterium]